MAPLTGQPIIISSRLYRCIAAHYFRGGNDRSIAHDNYELRARLGRSMPWRAGCDAAPCVMLGLHVQGARQLLHAVQQQISLLDDVDVDLTSLVVLVRLDDTTDLIDFA